jgi:hypothetical protein
MGAGQVYSVAGSGVVVSGGIEPLKQRLEMAGEPHPKP